MNITEPITDIWLQTFTGKRFYPLNPIIDDINIEDIAHALSLLCRFGGHVDRFYSVAEHCVLLAEWVNKENALAALLHDATEAYVVDMPRPIKYLLSEYREIELRAWYAITNKFNVELTLPDQVKEGDNRILLNECNTLMSKRERWSIDDLATPLPIKIQGWSPLRAEKEYLNKFKELYK